MTPAGIEPATFRFVAQHLNHCATAPPPPPLIKSSKYKVLVTSICKRNSHFEDYNNLEAFLCPVLSHVWKFPVIQPPVFAVTVMKVRWKWVCSIGGMILIVVPVPFGPQISNGLCQDLRWASAVRGRRITTRRGPNLICVTCKVTVLTSRGTQCASIRKTVGVFCRGRWWFKNY